MYEIMMYAGAIGCIAFFIVSVVLFIKNKIPSSIMYFVNLRRKGVDIWSANKKIEKQKIKPEKTLLLQDASVKIKADPTVLLEEAGSGEVYEADNEHTELLEDIPQGTAANAAVTDTGKSTAKKSTAKKKVKTKKQKTPAAPRAVRGAEATELLGDISAGGSEPTELLDYIAQQAGSGEPTQLLDDLPKVQGFEPTELLDDIPDYYSVGSQTELLD